MILDYPNQPPRSTDDAGEIATLQRKGWVARLDPPEYDPQTQSLSWDGAQWVVSDIPPAIHEKVATHKMLIAMDAAGLLEQVQALVNGAGGALKIAFDRAPEIHRASPMVAGMAAQLGLTEQQVDNLFIAAAQVQT